MSKAIGTLFGKPSKSASSSESASGYAALPDFAQQDWETLLGNASNLANNNTDIFENAPTTSLQNQGYESIGQQYTPESDEQFQAGVNQYMNPYTQDVIDTTNKNLQQQADQELSTLGGDASQLGAFGGTRQGVAQGVIEQNLNNTIATTDAALNSTGFNTAAQNAINQYQNTFTNQQGQALNEVNTGTQQQQINTQNQQAPATAQSWLQQLLSGLNSSTGQSNSVATGSSPGIIATIGNAINPK